MNSIIFEAIHYTSKGTDCGSTSDKDRLAYWSAIRAGAEPSEICAFAACLMYAGDMGLLTHEEYGQFANLVRKAHGVLLQRKQTPHFEALLLTHLKLAPAEAI